MAKKGGRPDHHHHHYHPLSRDDMRIRTIREDAHLPSTWRAYHRTMFIDVTDENVWTSFEIALAKRRCAKHAGWSLRASLD